MSGRPRLADRGRGELGTRSRATRTSTSWSPSSLDRQCADSGIGGGARRRSLPLPSNHHLGKLCSTGSPGPVCLPRGRGVHPPLHPPMAYRERGPGPAAPTGPLHARSPQAPGPSPTSRGRRRRAPRIGTSPRYPAPRAHQELVRLEGDGYRNIDAGVVDVDIDVPVRVPTRTRRAPIPPTRGWYRFSVRSPSSPGRRRTSLRRGTRTNGNRYQGSAGRPPVPRGGTPGGREFGDEHQPGAYRGRALAPGRPC